MPHIIIEYSSNLRDQLQPQKFVKKVHEAAMATAEFGPATLRTRASERTCYEIGDGHADNGFIHIVMRVRPGREPKAKRHLGEQVFNAVCDYLEPIFASRPLGLSFEVQEIETDFRFLKNNMNEYVEAHKNGKREREPLSVAGEKTRGA